MSNLSRFAHLMREPQPENALAAARDAYRESKGEIVLIQRSRLPSWADQKQLEILAEKAGVAPRRKC